MIILGNYVAEFRKDFNAEVTSLGIEEFSYANSVRVDKCRNRF